MQIRVGINTAYILEEDMLSVWAEVIALTKAQEKPKA
jgi:hypothetical protein